MGRHMLPPELNDLCVTRVSRRCTINQSDRAHSGALTRFLEELLPDAVRRGVLTRLDGHRQGRVLLDKAQRTIEDVTRTTQTATQDPRVPCIIPMTTLQPEIASLNEWGYRGTHFGIST